MGSQQISFQKRYSPNFIIFAPHKKNGLLIPGNRGRKVRTPQSGKAGNTRRSQDQDQCNRKYVY